jgi:hypothetical protein
MVKKKAGGTMKSIRLTLRADQYAALKRMSAETLVPMNAYIRKLIDEALKKKR